MKRTVIAFSAFVAATLLSCQKSDTASQISLTPSTTQAHVGQTVSVALSSNANASSWSVTPSSNVTKTYDITTSKTNYFTFNAAGTYTVSVRTKNVTDTTNGGSVNAAFNGTRTGGCTKGVDTASVSITVSDL